MPSVPMNFSTVYLEQGKPRKVTDWKCFHHACRLHFKREWSRSNLKTCGDFKGIVLPQIIFHPFTTHHFLDSGSGYFLIRITVLELYGWKESHPVEEYGGHGLQCKIITGKKHKMSPYCSCVVIQVSARCDSPICSKTANGMLKRYVFVKISTVASSPETPAHCTLEMSENAIQLPVLPHFWTLQCIGQLLV